MATARKVLLSVFLGLSLLALFLHTLVRMVRAFYKFPMPQFMASAIDNPLRRRIQPDDDIPTPETRRMNRRRRGPGRIPKYESH